MSKKILITGGAGFIGSNLASHHIKKGNETIVLDNLSRPGVENNLEWLKKQGNFTFIKEDIRNYDALVKLFKEHKDIDVVFHEAAQVAVTTSIQDPREDFDVNALGTFNILEAVRNYSKDSIVVYASTNKVYGNLGDIEVVEKDTRYEFKDERYKDGIPESKNLDFYSPYGCSTGAADQYVRDYARIYGLKTIVFRQSCIYGYRQMGLEDQGWVAWFAIRALLGKPITLYGDGKQIRDLLFIDDLVRAHELAIENISRIKGKIYNMGGGAQNTLSLLELIRLLEEFSGNKIEYSFSEERQGDQKVFIADVNLAKQDFSWQPETNTREGVKKLYDWLQENRTLFESLQ